jgi:stearoyl-CoA desaturase (delta-9 desaturase)
VQTSQQTASSLAEPAAPRGHAPEERLSQADGLWARAQLLPRVVYWGIHASCLLAFYTGVSRTALLLLATTFIVRLLGITGGYHRYFAHRSYRTSRVFQAVLALLGTAATQKGPLWWAGHHRRHHRYSDGPGDVHSPREGFWYSHQGWIFDSRWDRTPLDQIPDFARYPELVWLNRWHVVPPALVAALCFAIGGLQGVVWGFAISTTLLWHCTYSINSFAHLFGSRRYETGDTSRNNWLLALLTFGEGWHNNHHHYMASTRQGFFWWEIDLTYYVLRGLAAVGLVWDLREPPAHLLRPRPPSELRRAA